MKPFDHVISQLVERIRRSPAGDFVPHASSRRPEPGAHVPQSHGKALTSYRDIYRCPANTWGIEPHRDTEPASPRPHRSATIPFRIFDEP